MTCCPERIRRRGKEEDEEEEGSKQEAILGATAQRRHGLDMMPTRLSPLSLRATDVSH
jgi:hypothetical protein